jgi:hypothetical protein
MAKQAYVYSGTEWVPLASEVTNLSAYQTKALNQFPNRNLIINGAMQVAQRNTSVASITSSGYRTVDRFGHNVTTLGTWTMSQENDAPTGSGFRKSTKVLCTTADASPAAGDYSSIYQILEGQNLQAIKKGTAAAEQLTISFWVKSNVTGTYIVAIYDNDNTRSVSKSYTVNASGTWEYKTITFPADTTGAFDNDNGASLILEFVMGSGTDRTSGTLQTTWGSYTAANYATGQTNLASATNNYWQVTGVQLEVGDTATPFEFLPAQQELAQCQRYYHRYTADEAYAQFANGMTWSTTSSRFAIQMPTTMRTVPTIGSSNLGTKSSNGSIQAVTSFALESACSSKHAIGTIATVAAGLTANYPAVLQANNNTSAYLEVIAEL